MYQELKRLIESYNSKLLPNKIKKNDELVSFINQKWEKTSFSSDNFMEKIYYAYYEHISVCYYNNKRKFNSFNKGYNEYCKQYDCSCRKNNKSKKISEKLKEKSNELKEKRDNTIKQKYGVKNPMHSDYLKRKFFETNMKNHGCKTPLQSDAINKKIKNTNLIRYGVEKPLQSQEIREKGHRTYLNNYGKLMFHARKKLYEIYGKKNPFQDKDIKEKIDKTNIQKYGKKRYSSTNEGKEKIKNVIKQRYNVKNPSQAHYTKNVYDILNNKQKFDSLYQNYGLIGLSNHLGIHDTTIASYVDFYGLPRKQKRSSHEDVLKIFLDNQNVDYYHNNKKFMFNNGYNLELDFYIPNKSLAIEICGLYYHSDNFKYKDYHKLKHDICLNNGIQLLTIFEDELIEKPEIVKNIIKSKLGFLNKGVYARNTNICEINKETSEMFLNKFHIQGTDTNSNLCLGAFYNDKLIAVMSFGNRPNNNDVELKRYACDNYVNPGIASKLFKHYLNNYHDINKNIVTFADKRYSDGDLYYHLGFQFNKENKPNYWYAYRCKKYHRSKFRKSELMKMYNLDTKDFNEKEFMKNLGYNIIWDCGYYKFIWEK